MEKDEKTEDRKSRMCFTTLKYGQECNLRIPIGQNHLEKKRKLVVIQWYSIKLQFSGQQKKIKPTKKHTTRGPSSAQEAEFFPDHLEIFLQAQ